MTNHGPARTARTKSAAALTVAVHEPIEETDAPCVAGSIGGGRKANGRLSGEGLIS